MLRVAGFPKFGTITPAISTNGIQSYIDGAGSTVPVSLRHRFLDFRHLNGPSGSGPETKDNICTMASAPALQSGTNQVYKIASACGSWDRRQPMFVQAGPYIFSDKSGPSSTLTDSDEGRWCHTRLAGECVATSSAGDVFASSKYYDGSTACYRNTNEAVNPCAYTGYGIGGQIMEYDATAGDPEGIRQRRLTYALNGPGRQYHFSEAFLLPGGRWMIFPAAWVNGVRKDWYVARLPQWAPDSTNRTTWVPHAIKLGSGVASGNVVAKFGYGENGAGDSYYGTSRAEATVAPDAAINATTPFQYYDGGANDEIDGTDGQACASGCTITVPAIPGRVLYYELFSNSAGTLTAIDGTKRAVAVN